MGLLSYRQQTGSSHSLHSPATSRLALFQHTSAHEQHFRLIAASVSLRIAASVSLRIAASVSLRIAASISLRIAASISLLVAASTSLLVTASTSLLVTASISLLVTASISLLVTASISLLITASISLLIAASISLLIAASISLLVAASISLLIAASISLLVAVSIFASSQSVRSARSTTLLKFVRCYALCALEKPKPPWQMPGRFYCVAGGLWRLAARHCRFAECTGTPCGCPQVDLRNVRAPFVGTHK